MSNWLLRMWYKFERRWHAVDAQLAYERFQGTGSEKDLLFAIDCECRIDECSRQILRLELNK